MGEVITAEGCAGACMVNRMIERRRVDVERLAINTDRRELAACRARRDRTSEAEVLPAEDAMVEASVERLMTPEGWKLPVEGRGKRARVQQRVLGVQGG